MMTLARWNAGSRLALAAASTVLLAGCAGGPKQMPVGDGIVTTDQRTAKALGAPVVSLATEQEPTGFRTIQTRLRLQDDAYVLVVNVTPDGVARILFPQSPTDDGLLQGGKTYVLPRFFAGYPSLHLQTTTSSTQFVMVHRSVDATAMTQGPGYTFAIASKTPFNMQRLQDKGYFEWVELGQTLWELEPRAVISVVADAALASNATFVASADVARYAGYIQAARPTSYAWGRANAMRSSFCYVESWSPRWRPLDPWGISSDGCGPDELLRRRLLEVNRVTPVRPDSTPTDSATADSAGTESAIAAAALRANAFTYGAPAQLSGPHSADEIELNTTERQRMLRQERFEGVRNGRERLIDLERRERALDRQRREELIGRERSQAARSRRTDGDMGGEGPQRTWERPAPERQAVDERRAPEPQPVRHERPDGNAATARERSLPPARSGDAAPARPHPEATPRTERVERQP